MVRDGSSFCSQSRRGCSKVNKGLSVPFPEEEVWGENLLWQQVGHLKSKVLNDNIELLVLVLGSWDGNVANLLSNGWDNDMSQVLDEVRLVLEVSCRTARTISIEQSERVESMKDNPPSPSRAKLLTKFLTSTPNFLLRGSSL